jgi:ribosomal protein S18 acetylase RimI-like enzyme
MTATEAELRVEPATARDVPALAALHRACLPESMISMLGAAAVERYYALAATSPFEHVLVARADLGGSNRQGAKDAKQRDGRQREGRRDDDAVSAVQDHHAGERTRLAAACVLTLEPNTVMSRFARHAPLSLASDLVRQSLDPGFRRRLLARVREAAGSGAGAAGSGAGAAGSGGPGVPEVTQIFTDAAYRGRGLGRGLLRACEARLRELGQLAYCIHTLRDDNDAGIRFYRREGFTETGTSRSFGDTYLVMTKGLS